MKMAIPVGSTQNFKEDMYQPIDQGDSSNRSTGIWI